MDALGVADVLANKRVLLMKLHVVCSLLPLIIRHLRVFLHTNHVNAEFLLYGGDYLPKCAGTCSNTAQRVATHVETRHCCGTAPRDY